MPWTAAEKIFSVEKLNWLREHLQDRLISRRCDPEWSSHSPDLNPVDFSYGATSKTMSIGIIPKSFMNWRRPYLRIFVRFQRMGVFECVSSAEGLILSTVWKNTIKRIVISPDQWNLVYRPCIKLRYNVWCLVAIAWKVRFLLTCSWVPFFFSPCIQVNSSVWMRFQCIQNHIFIDYFTTLHTKQLNSKKTRFPRIDKIFVI